MLKDIPIVPKELKKIEYNDNYIVIDPNIPVWTVIDEIGKDIIELCDGKNSVNDIIKKLCILYNVKQDIIQDDVVNFLSKLYLKNFVFAELKDYKRLLKDIEKVKKDRIKKDVKRDLSGASIIVTNSCNLKCKHCYQDSSPLKKHSLAVDEVKSVLLYLSNVGAKRVAFNGGEPLLWEGIYECMEFASSLELDVVLATNGLLLNEENISFFAEKENIHIQISIDGATENTHDKIRGTGTFKKTINNIEQFIRAGLGKHISFSFTPMKYNIAEVELLIDSAYHLEVSGVRFTRFNTTGRGSEYMRADTDSLLELEHILKKKSKELKGLLNIQGLWSENCRIENCIDPFGSCLMFDMIKIDYLGYVFPCAPFTDIKFSIGNIRKEKLREIITPRRKKRLIELISSRSNLIDECSNCLVKKYCSSGCTAETYSAYKNIYHVDPHCEVRKKIIIESLYELVDKNV